MRIEQDVDEKRTLIQIRRDTPPKVFDKQQENSITQSHPAPVERVINGIGNSEYRINGKDNRELLVTSERELLSRIGLERVDIADCRNPMLEINSQY